MKPVTGVLGDSRDVLTALNAELKRKGFNPRSREQDLIAIKEQTNKDIQEVQPQHDYLHAIRAVLPRDGFFVT